MIDIIVILLYLTFPFLVVSFYLLNKESLTAPTLISITFWFYLISAYIGIIILYFGLDEYRVAIGVTNKEIMIKLLICSGSALIIFTTSYLIFSKIIEGRYKVKMIKISEKARSLKSKEIIFLLSLFIASFFVLIFYLFKLPEVPLMAQLKGYPTAEIKQLRSMATNDFSGSLHYYKIFFETFLLFICFSFFSNYLIKRNTISFMLFIGPFLVSLFVAIHTTAKAPFVWLVIGLVFVYLITMQKKIVGKYLLPIGIIILIVLFFFYKYFMGMDTRTNMEILNSVFSRAFTGQLTPAYYYLEIFPSQMNYLYGTSFPNPGGLLPFENFRLTVEVMNMKFSHLAGLGIVGSAPTAYWGELYANFSYLGILIGSIYIGLILAITQHFYNSHKKNAVNIAIYVSVMLELKDISVTGISNFLFNINFIALVFVFIFFNYFLREQKEKKHGSQINRNFNL